MPLAYREVLLVIRGQNTASPAIRSLITDFATLNKAQTEALDAALQRGRSLITLGAAVGAVGAAGLAFFGEATKQAIDYNRQVALTKTQMFGVKASFDQTAQAGLEVARSIAVPLDQIQAGLYDIFSSMDVNLTQAKFLLTNFSKEAVAGQVDLSTAERATIGIMNAYQMKVGDVTKVQDIMFNLVKYGVGTYENFANVIGRVTGPAVRMNQTFDQTAALMAFTTRNGLSASNAASSVGRALDAIGKSRDKIQNFGDIVVGALGKETAGSLGITANSMIQVVDAAGRMLPVNQIMTNLGMALKGLNPTQLNDVLTEMFKGTGGTIQAMRFVDIAVHNYGQLNTIVKEMANSKGALQSAYDTMANTPAMQIQLLKNNFHVLMIEIGDVLLPVVNKLVKGITALFTWFGRLPHPLIVIATVTGTAISVLLVLGGVVLMMAGAFVILTAATTALDIALSPIIALVLLVVVAIGALAAAAYFLYKYWDPVSKWFHDMWFDMWHWIDKIWGDIWRTIKSWWDKIVGVFNGVKNWFTKNFDAWWKTHGESIKIIWKYVWDFIGRYIKVELSLVINIAKIFFTVMETLFKTGIALWRAIFKIVWDIIVGIFRIAMAIILAAFRIWWSILTTVAKIAWAAIQFVIKNAWDIIVGIFSIFIDIITGHWHQAWVDLLAMAHQIWNNIKNLLSTIWHAIGSLFQQVFGAIKDMGVSIWHSMYNTVIQVWNAIFGFFKSMWANLKSGFQSVVHDLGSIWDAIRNAFMTPVNWVIRFVYDDGIAKVWNTVVNAIGLSKIDLPIVKTLAAGGRLAGFGGGDRIPALLEAGETVIDKNKSRDYAWLFSMMGVKGYAQGGIVSQGADFVKMAAAVLTGNPVAFANAMAGSFLGKTPLGAHGNYGTMLSTLPGALLDVAVKGVWSQITNAWNTASGPHGGHGLPFPVVGTGPTGGDAAANKALALKMFPWPMSMWSSYDYLEMREAGYNRFARNPSSGAYGIPQALPPSKMPFAAQAAGGSHAGPQLSWMYGYIGQVYGNPVNAANHERAVSWYGDGTDQVFDRPTVIGVGDRPGGERVQVGPAGRGGPVQNFYITTQEIDPRRHAAELGWELARRSG
jgi:TP901 family phage tail tape measure protein